MIDLKVYGEPGSCRVAATGLADGAVALRTAAGDLEAVDSRSSAVWAGGAAEAFRTRVEDVREDLDELRGRVRTVEKALETLAGELTAVENAMAQARETARAGGVGVTAHSIAEPTFSGDPTDEAQVAAHDAEIEVYNQAVTAVQEARDREAAAHEAFQTSLDRAVGDGWVLTLLRKLGLAPPEHLDLAGGVLWGAGLAGTGFGVGADWMIKGRYGVFQPRDAGGRFGSAKPLTRWQRGIASLDSDNWRATSYDAATRNRWATAGRWTGRAGAALSFATSSLDEWRSSADDPSMSTSERVGSAATVGATTAAGAWAGASLGAQAGGAIGTMICPGAGTVIGGAVGGLVGGFAGSELGGAVGDALKTGVGEAAGAVTDFAGGAVDNLGDVAGDVGDTLSFWD